jgi:hypothetical protein
MLDGCVLERVVSIRDLGVIIDSKMTFTDHIDIIVGRASATLGIIQRLAREFEDPYTFNTLFISLVRPKLEYASCVCDPI